MPAEIPQQHTIANEPLSIDEIIDAALVHCRDLPQTCNSYVEQIKELRNRLAMGQLHLAVLGQFNRGKSTFINALIRQKILPTSVLPVTSVPTFISYGEQLCCTVRFLNKKPDLVVKQSKEKIVETLTRYVAEENNPNNQFCVRDVRLACSSPILENGTVLIDTPGFGSTYLHNTRTALDALVECDAALFLLSADPPMTQTEIEFLKQVQQYVPRIFFILNKIDLLKSNDLETVDRFIRQMLISRLGYNSEVKLFHVCAARAERASECTPQDKNWVSGNMEIIKTEILEFMIREKYFTLSQALNDKLEDAFTGIISVLQQGIDEFNTPLEMLKSESKDFLNQVDSVKKNMDKEMRLVQVEKDAVLGFLKEQITKSESQMGPQVFAYLDKLLNSASGNMNWIEGLATSIGRYIVDCFSNLLITYIAQVNKPLQKAAMLHGKEYELIASSVQKLVLGSGYNAKFHEHLDNIEVAIEEDIQIKDVSTELDVRTSWTDYFKSRSGKIDQIKARWTNIIEEVIQSNFETLRDYLYQKIDLQFEKLKEILSSEYGLLSNELDNLVKRKEDAIQERNSRKDNPLEPHQKLIEAFTKVREQLY